ncbi:MAG: DUF1624 domain-containing protein [Christensenellaceae bacterium]|jgi:uncharacterized membrane protein|nr:DUF1624 domain-containing protein [Christensenellaceae bacterium]
MTSGFSLEENNNVKFIRIREIDILRGFCILLMFVDHFAFFILKFDVFHWTEQSSTFLDALIKLSKYFYSGNGRLIRDVIRYFVLDIYFIISGICCSFSKSNLKRSFKLATVAISITLSMFFLSLIMKQDFNIYFGILHCYASCVFIYWVITKLPKKLFYPCLILLVLCSVIIGLLNPTLQSSNILLPFGIPSATYSPAIEYDPIFPSIAIFVFGAILGKTLYKNKRPLCPALEKIHHHPISFVGQHGLIFYIAHIPILAIIVWILGVIAYCHI